MKRSGKGAWPIVLLILLALIAGGVYFYTRTTFADRGYVGNPYACANGVNVIVVSDPYKASNWSSIASSVKRAIRNGGSNSSIIIVSGKFSVDEDSHIDDLLKALSKLGAAGLYVYPTNQDDYESEYALNLRGATYTADLKETGVSSKQAEFQKKAALVNTTKEPSEDALPILQIWDIDSFERRDVDLSNASVKIVVGSKDKNTIACDLYVFTGDGQNAGVMSAIGGIAGGKASFNYETSTSRLFMYCGTSGAKDDDRLTTRHSIGVVEIANNAGD